MASSGAPLALIAIVGVGAYFLGRYDERQKDPAPPVPPPDAPRPPIPGPPDAAMPALPPAYAAQWDAALERYEIDVYPPEAVARVESLLPPPTPDGISVSTDCQTVAVGEDWWELAANYAKGQGDRPAGAVAQYVLSYLAPTCATRNSVGAAGLRQALVDWLRSSQLVRNEGRLTST